MNLPDFLTTDRQGFIHLARHRVGLRHIVELYNERHTAEMLHDHFPTVPLALIHKVLAFYLENVAEVDTYIQESRAALQRQAATAPRGPDAAELRRRMSARKPKESGAPLRA